ncbi:MAG: cytochrome c [Phycisphaerales bacterium]|nr:cytochrome c [Phycisphaerales bacterium]
MDRHFRSPIRTIVPIVLSAAVLGAGGCTENSTPAATIGSAETVVSLAEGRSLYMAHCMMCHQPQGEGVMGMQPRLSRSEVVQGDVGYLVEVTILGMGDHPGGLAASGQFRQQMEGFPDLTDSEVAAILTYIRRSWGNNASAVTEDEVWEIRQGL